MQVRDDLQAQKAYLGRNDGELRAWVDGQFAAGKKMAYVPPTAIVPREPVSSTYKALSAVAGMASDGLGVVTGVAMTGTGLGLTLAPEPTTLTKWAGVPLTAFGATYTAKSVVGFGLNATNFVTAVRGITAESAYMPGSALEWAVRAGGGSPEAERVALAVDMTWGLASGRVLDARIATGVVTNPRVAALLQPAVVTTVAREATILAPGAWSSIVRIEPRASLLDLSFKVNDNLLEPLFFNVPNKP